MLEESKNKKLSLISIMEFNINAMFINIIPSLKAYRLLNLINFMFSGIMKVL